MSLMLDITSGTGHKQRFHDPGITGKAGRISAMTIRELVAFVKRRYVDPQYSFKDRLYFLFGTAGTISAGAAFAAAIGSGLPWIAAAASLTSFFVMLVLMAVSFFMDNIGKNRIFCSVFLNFFMFPALFWVTGGVNCGMIFYFILGLSVAALILEGKCRAIVLTLALIFHTLNLHLGFRYPELAYLLNYEERWMDTVSSFLIVSVFIIAVILIMSVEYGKEHDKVVRHAEILNQQAITDNLTKLYNRRFLMDTLKNMVDDYGAQQGGISLLLLDIDDFKKVNDTFGHLRGDKVLCRLSAILKEKAGEKYIAVRYGGEEFMLVLPDCPQEAAMQFAEMIRLDVYHDEELAELTQNRFSISGGVTCYEKGISIEEWIRRADNNLYLAKSGGKNRIVGESLPAGAAGKGPSE